MDAQPIETSAVVQSSTVKRQTRTHVPKKQYDIIFIVISVLEPYEDEADSIEAKGSLQKAIDSVIHKDGSGINDLLQHNVPANAPEEEIELCHIKDRVVYGAINNRLVHGYVVLQYNIYGTLTVDKARLKDRFVNAMSEYDIGVHISKKKGSNPAIELCLTDVLSSIKASDLMMCPALKMVSRKVVSVKAPPVPKEPPVSIEPPVSTPSSETAQDSRTAKQFDIEPNKADDTLELTPVKEHKEEQSEEPKKLSTHKVIKRAIKQVEKEVPQAKPVTTSTVKMSSWFVH